LLNSPEPDVMPVTGILRAGIAEPDNQFHSK
jgi:hypothetical protein